jgi:hypothetical protein
MVPPERPGEIDKWAFAKRVRFPHKAGIVALLDMVEYMVVSGLDNFAGFILDYVSNRKAAYTAPLTTIASGTYTPAEAQAVIDKLNDVIAKLQAAGLMDTSAPQ